jgi:hypothetical protein
MDRRTGQRNWAEIPDVVAPILAGQADVVYGSRFMVMAGLYILYYNLVAPRLPKGRRYIAEVNRFLAEEACSPAPAVVAAAGTASA